MASKIKIEDTLIKMDSYSSSFNSEERNYESAEEIVFLPNIESVTGTGTLDLSFQTSLDKKVWFELGISDTFTAATDTPNKRKYYVFTEGLLRYFRIAATISGATFKFEVKICLEHE